MGGPSRIEASLCRNSPNGEQKLPNSLAWVTSKAHSRPDTLVPSDIAYQGYRIHVREIELLKQRKNRYLLRVDLVNTGKRAVGFGPGFPARFLQTDFDDSIVDAGLVALAEPLRAALLASDLKLESGDGVSDQEYWVIPGEAAKRPEARIDTFSRRASPITRTRATTSSAVTSSPPVAAACPDLQVTKLAITQRSKSTLTLQLSVTNSGKLSIDKARAGAGATLDIYVGGSASITNASRLLARIALSDRLRGLGAGEGLAAGEVLTIVQVLDIAQVTKYNGVLTVQIDPGQVILECDETNNTSSLALFE